MFTFAPPTKEHLPKRKGSGHAETQQQEIGRVDDSDTSACRLFRLRCHVKETRACDAKRSAVLTAPRRQMREPRDAKEQRHATQAQMRRGGANAAAAAWGDMGGGGGVQENNGTKLLKIVSKTMKRRGALASLAESDFFLARVA
jgi:hypothetical protein